LGSHALVLVISRGPLFLPLLLLVILGSKFGPLAAGLHIVFLMCLAACYLLPLPVCFCFRIFSPSVSEFRLLDSALPPALVVGF
jgi:hypothetical protein